MNGTRVFRGLSCMLIQLNPIVFMLKAESNWIHLNPTFVWTCGCPKCPSDTNFLTNGFEQLNLSPQLRAIANFWRLKNCYSEISKNNWFIQKVHIILFFEFLKTPQNKGYILINFGFKYELLTPLSLQERAKTRFFMFSCLNSIGFCELHRICL